MSIAVHQSPFHLVCTNSLTQSRAYPSRVNCVKKEFPQPCRQSYYVTGLTQSRNTSITLILRGNSRARVADTRGAQTCNAAR